MRRGAIIGCVVIGALGVAVASHPAHPVAAARQRPMHPKCWPRQPSPSSDMVTYDETTATLGFADSVTVSSPGSRHGHAIVSSGDAITAGSVVAPSTARRSWR